MEDTTAQERIRQLLLRIGSDNHDRAVLCLDRLSGLRNIKFHLVKLPEQVVRELQIRLIDLVDKENRLFFLLKRLAHLSETDVSGNIINAVRTKLAVVKTLYRIVHIKTVLCAGRRFNIPDQKFHIEGSGNRLREHRLSSARFSLDQERLFERRRNVNAADQFIRSDVFVTAVKLLHGKFSF